MRKKNRVGTAIGIATLVTTVSVAATVVCGVVGAVEAGELRDELSLAQSDGVKMEQQVRDLKVAEAVKTVASLQGHTSRAKHISDGFLWKVGSRLPYLGDDVRAVRTSASVLDTVAHKALPNLVSVAKAVDPATIRMANGGYDVRPLAEARGKLGQAKQALETAQATTGQISTESLLPQVGSKVEQLSTVLGRSIDTASEAEKVATLLPGLLGVDKPRNILVIFQNNAELRSGGGIPGSAALMRAEGGKVQIVRQFSTADFGEFEKPVLPLGDDGKVFTEKTGRFFQNITMTPDFPTTARLAQEMVRRVTVKAGQPVAVDAVISVDPVALSYLLKASGPVTLAGGKVLNHQNAVPELLNRVYFEMSDPKEQDAFFASAASSIFEQTVRIKPDKAVRTAVSRAADEGRIRVWSSDETEQTLLLKTNLAGAMPHGESQEDFVGVFFNDMTRSKMSYYLDGKVDVRRQCISSPADPRQQIDGGFVITTRLKSLVQRDVQKLPAYVRGGLDVETGSIRTGLAVYLPSGSQAVSVRVDGKDVPTITRSYRGRSVVFVMLENPVQAARELVVVATPSTGLVRRKVVTPAVRNMSDLSLVNKC